MGKEGGRALQTEGAATKTTFGVLQEERTQGYIEGGTKLG